VLYDYFMRLRKKKNDVEDWFTYRVSTGAILEIFSSKLKDTEPESEEIGRNIFTYFYEPSVSMKEIKDEVKREAVKKFMGRFVEWTKGLKILTTDDITNAVSATFSVLKGAIGYYTTLLEVIKARKKLEEVGDKTGSEELKEILKDAVSEIDKLIEESSFDQVTGMIDSANRIIKEAISFAESKGLHKESDEMSSVLCEYVSLSYLPSQKEIQEGMERARNLVEGVIRAAGDNPASVSNYEKAIYTLYLSRQDQNVLKYLGNLLEVSEGMRKREISEDRSTKRYGREIDKAVPSQIAFLLDGDLSDLEMKKIAEGTLTVYGSSEKEKAGYGPFVMCLDVSGSMREMRERLLSRAKAVAIFLALKAKKRGIPFILIPFDSEPRKAFILLPDEKDYIKKAFDRIGRLTACGGTNYTRAIEKALEESRKFSENYGRKPDLLFISDGRPHDEYNPEVLSEAEDFFESKVFVGIECEVTMGFNNFFDKSVVFSGSDFHERIAESVDELLEAEKGRGLTL